MNAGKKGRKPSRALAGILCFCMLIELCPEFSGGGYITWAKEREEQEAYEITAFEELEKEVQEQTVYVGTPLEEILLPIELKAEGSVLKEEKPNAQASLMPGASKSPVASTTPVASEVPTASPRVTPTGLPVEAPTQTPDEIGEETPTQTPEGTGEETPTQTPDGSGEETPTQTPGGSGEEAPTQTPDGSGEETPTQTPDETGEETPTQTPDETGEEMPVQTPDGTEGSQEQELEGNSLADNSEEEQEDASLLGSLAKGFIEMWTPMSVWAAESSDEITEEETVQSLQIQVTWESTPAYDQELPGDYIFTPVIPEEYVLGEGVSLPEILIHVTDVVDGGEIELLMRPSEEDSSDMVYYLKESYQKYAWELWTGEEWYDLAWDEPELPVSKEDWYTWQYRCIVEKDGIRYTARGEDDWQIENFGIMTMADSVDGESDYLRYAMKRNFNIEGIDQGTIIRTTYADAGYTTISSVGESNKNWNSSIENAMGKSLYGKVEVSLVHRGRYAMVKYTVENRGSESQNFRLGTCADVMIGNNDYAPVTGSANGLTMNGEPKNQYAFNLIAPTANTLWYGHYSDRTKNVFTNLSDRTWVYNKDSGMAWSWEDTIAPGAKWSRYILIGVGEQPPMPDAPEISNRDPVLKPGQETVFTGTSDPGNTVCISVGGEEFTGTADENGSFTVPVTPPEDMPDGPTKIDYYAVSPEGGISEVKQIDAVVIGIPKITLTDEAVTVLEESVLDEEWYLSKIRESVGTVTYDKDAVKTNTPGTYTVLYRAHQEGYQDAVARLKVTVVSLPLELSEVTVANGSGKDSVTFTATLKYTGGETITESGFVWGMMQNPTTEMYNGKQATAAVVKTKNGRLQATGQDIADGVDYYVRAYVGTVDGKVYYSPQKRFDLAGKAYGTFSIKNNGNNKFTVSRTGGSGGEQTVYFRTVNGSAVGGTHFIHQAGTLTFGEGETSKEITVTEKSVIEKYGNRASTAFSNGDRTYQVEIYRVEGGAELGSDKKAARTMAKDGGYTIDRALYTTAKSKTENPGDGTRWVADRSNCDNGDVFLVNNRNKNSNPLIINGSEQKYDNKTLQRNFSTSVSLASVGGYSENQKTYLAGTAGNFLYRQRLVATEDEDGWEHIWIGDHVPPAANLNNHVGASCTSTSIPLGGGVVQERMGTGLYAASFSLGSGSSTFYFPNKNHNGGSEYVNNSATDGRPNHARTENCFDYNGNTWVKLSISGVAYAYYGASGKNEDRWYVNQVENFVLPYDEKEPQIIGVAPMADSVYRGGEEFTVSLIFDEIVDGQNSTNISQTGIYVTLGGSTSIQCSYSGGVNTNVLYFTGTVPQNAPDSASGLKLGDLINFGNIKDMCNANGTAAGKGSSSLDTNLSCDNKGPVLSITNQSNANGIAKGTVTAANADELQFAWSQSADMPVKGWQKCTNGQTLSSRPAGTGKYYLYVIGTYSVTGKSAYTYAEYTFSSGAGVLPDLVLSTDNSKWAQSRSIALTRKPSGAAVTVKTPSGSTGALSSGDSSYTATENGNYTFTLTSNGEKVVKSISVSKIDRVKPGASVSGPAVKTQSENVTLTVTPFDEGGSGVKSVAGTWTVTTNGGAQSTVAATLTKQADGSYQAKTPGQSGNQYTYKLNVTVTDNAGNQGTKSSDVYTVQLKAPIVTVNKLSGSEKGDVYSYTVNANGNVITQIQLPDGSFTDQLNGSFTLTAPGTYYVIVSDQAGHVVRSSAMTVAEGVDGDAPEIRLFQPDEDWTNQDTEIKVSIYEVSQITSAIWECESGTWGILDYSKETDTAYEGSFLAPENGEITVTVYDNKGNMGTAAITVANIDKTAPSMEIELKAEPNATTGWYLTSIPVNLSWKDNENGAEGGEASGIQSVEYGWVTSKEGTPQGLKAFTKAEIAKGSGSITLTENGIGYLYYKAVDYAGNVKEGFSEQIKKDTTARALTITGPDQGVLAKEGLSLHIQSAAFGPSGGYVTVRKSTEATEKKILDQSGSGRLETDYPITGDGVYYVSCYTYANDKPLVYTKYVRRVSFNSQGGSAVEPQLVWTRLGSDSTSTDVQCKVAKPADPTLTGHTFGGWYTDQECTSAFDFNTQVKANTTLYAKWTANTYQVSYHLKGYTPETMYKSYTYGKGLTLPVLEREGYVFDGWYKDESYRGEKYTAISKTQTENQNFYARWKDVRAPLLTAALSDGGDGSRWYREENQPSVLLQYSDNEGVSQVLVSVDKKEFEALPVTTGSATQTPTKASYSELLEGEHTYVFRAVDEAGNETLTQPLTIKLDTEKPVLGEITYDKKAVHFLDWIIGKDSLVITIPVAEEGSGAKELTCTVTKAGEAPENRTVKLSGSMGEQKAELIFEAEWKGTITNITCVDEAGNQADSKSVSNENGGVIVENAAPVIRILEADMTDPDHPGAGGALSEDYYEETDIPTLYVEVTDDSSAAVTSGIAFINYTISGTGYKVQREFENEVKGTHAFVISLNGQAGVVGVTVNAGDHAGNLGRKSVTVKLKGQERKPEAKISYPEDKITNLVPGETYEVKTDDGKVKICVADEEGKLAIEEQWTGHEIFIVKKGDGGHTHDSQPQELSVAARPKALDPEKDLTVTPEIAKGAEDAQIKITITVDHGDMEYSTDGGKTWTPVPEDQVIPDLGPGDVLIRDKATEDQPHGEEAVVTIAQSDITLTAEFDLNGQGASKQPAPQKGKIYTDLLTKPGDPVRKGYAFEGWYRDASGEHPWNFREDTIGSAIDREDYRVDETSRNITVTLYAKWRDVEPPVLKAVPGEGKDPDKWHQELKAELVYSDNVGVVKLYVKIDQEEEQELTGLTTGGATTQETIGYYALTREGSHTYRFKAADAAGNTVWSKEFQGKLDTTAPVLGEIAYNEGYANIWNWIIQKESLIISIPVTEAGSGVEKVEYVLTAKDGTPEPKQAKLVTESGAVTAKITVDADFKGTVTQIKATDYAGNVSQAKAVNGEGNGILVEQNKPLITILADCYPEDTTAATQPQGVALSDAYYETAPNLIVKIKDDNGELTSGLESVAWKINNGGRQQEEGGFHEAMKEEYSFLMGNLGGRTGTVSVTIYARDHAGNTEERTIILRIKGQEETPEIKVDYQENKLVGLIPGDPYMINDGIEGLKSYTADEEGKITLEEPWAGKELLIIKKGDGENTSDSEAQILPVAERPEAPELAPDGKQEESIKNKKDGSLTFLQTGIEYSTDGGKSWIRVEGNQIAGLAAGEVSVRIAATQTSPWGEAYVTDIKEGRTLSVAFVSNGGSAVPVIEGKAYHDSVEKPEDPVRTGYVFGGWYREETFRNKWKFAGQQDADRMEGDILLYGKWIPREETPNPSLERERELLTGLTPGADYLIQGKTETASKDGTIPLKKEYFGKEIEIIKKGDGNQWEDSNPCTVSIPQRPQVPADIKAVGESAQNAKDGKLTGLDNTMEYRRAGSSQWIPVEESTLTNLAPGTYEVRYRATEDSFASREAVIEIPSYTKEEKPGDAEPPKEDTGTDQENRPGDSNSGGSTSSGSEEQPEETLWPEPLKTPKKEAGLTEGIPVESGRGNREEAGNGRRPGKTVEATRQPGEETSPSGDSASPTENIAGKETGGETVPYQEAKGKPVTESIRVAYGKGRIHILVESLNENQEITGDVITGVILTSFDNVLDATLTKEEQGRADAGEDVTVRLVVTKLEQQVPEKDRRELADAVAVFAEEHEGLSMGTYIDISVEKKIGEGEWLKLRELNEELEISLDIPRELLMEDAFYWVLRNHEGNCELLEDQDQEAETITIRTKLFSTYAILYAIGDSAGKQSGLAGVFGRGGYLPFLVAGGMLLLLLLLILLGRKKSSQEEEN